MNNAISHTWTVQSKGYIILYYVPTIFFGKYHAMTTLYPRFYPEAWYSTMQYPTGYFMIYANQQWTIGEMGQNI